MNTANRWLASILCTAMLPLLVSCTTIPTDSSVGNMSVKQAREVLAKRLDGATGAAIVDSHSKERIADVRAQSSRLIVTDNRGKQTIFIYRELPQISYSFLPSAAVRLAGQDRFHHIGQGDIVINALNVLKQNAIKQKTEVDEFDASFAASLADYRKKAASNAALPEEANKYKVQAEGAVRDKEFDDAADLYAAALKIAPWWPVGHFNRALVLGEAGDYELAKREMNYYLQLVPNAPNARAAQNKIYEWERLESK